MKSFLPHTILLLLLLCLSASPLFVYGRGHANLHRLFESQLEQQLDAGEESLQLASDEATLLIHSFAREEPLRHVNTKAQLTSATHSFTQTLDHFSSSDSRTFSQRYHVSLHSYRPGGPIFLYVGGEAPLTNRSVTTGFAKVLAETYGGALFGLEHRFYGRTQPFDDLRTENLVYLTIEQALEDAALFIQSMSVEYNLGSSPWFSIGGSYPGALSAFLRLRYPHLISGSLASSAPILAQAAFWEYDAAVSVATGQQCADQIRAANQLIEQRLDEGGEASKAVKEQFGCGEFDPNDPNGFLYVLADAVAYAIQYTSSSNPSSSNYQLQSMLCDRWMLNPTSGSDPVDRFAGFFDQLLGRLNHTCYDFTTTLPVLNDTSIGDDLSQRQWFWQSCLQFGFFQTAPNMTLGQPEPLRSTRITLEYHLDLCRQVFGEVHMSPEVDRVNGRYGGLDVRSSRIYFTNGAIDPWRELSLKQDPSCCASIHTKVINGTAHCADLGTADPLNDPSDLTVTRADVVAKFGEWINGLDQPDCPAYLVNCNGTCVDTQTNVRFCGSCTPTQTEATAGDHEHTWYCRDGQLVHVVSSSAHSGSLLAIAFVVGFLGLVTLGCGLHALRKVDTLRQMRKMELTERAVRPAGEELAYHQPQSDMRVPLEYERTQW